VKPSLRNIIVSKYSLLILAILLFGISVIFNKLYTNRTSVAREARLMQNYLLTQESHFYAFVKDTALIRKFVLQSESRNDLKNLRNQAYTTFLYTADAFGSVQMKAWSDQQAIPPQDIFAKEDGEYFDELNNGKYLVVKETISLPGIQDSILALAAIPIHIKYFIETDYLPIHFAHSKTAQQRIIISDHVTEFPVRSLSGNTILYLERRASGAVPYNNLLTIILRLSAMLLIFLFVQLLVESVSRKRGPLPAIGLLAVIVLVIRLAIYFYPSLLNLRQFELFDPAIYGSNAVQRSLGDLLINALFFCWIVLFAWSKLQRTIYPLKGLPGGRQWAAAILSLFLITISTFLFASVIKSIVANSKISFDVTDFFSLDIYTVFGFVVLAALALSYYYLSQLLFRFVLPLFEKQMTLLYLALTSAGLIYLTLRGAHEASFYVPVLGWLLLYTWLLSQQGFLTSRFRVNIAGMLSWIFVFSVSISAIMLAEIKQVEWERRKSIAAKLADQTDPSSERLLKIALTYIDNDFLSENYYRFIDVEKGKKLRDSILTVNYTGYLNKYDSKLFVFDANDQPLNNEDNTRYDNINTLIQVQANPTAIPGLYYYETSFDKFIYITKREIQAPDSSKMGTLFIVSNPKRFSSDAFFPELFKEFDRAEPENSPIYAYAIFSRKNMTAPFKLGSSFNKYPFPIWLRDDELPKTEVNSRMNGDYEELWYRVSKGKVIVIARKMNTIIETITLFSYIFCSFLFLVAFGQFLSLVLKTFTNRDRLRKVLQLNIRGQVHGTVIFISVLSFIIIGISTISFFITRYERNNNDKLSRTMQIMVNEMQKELSNQSAFDDVLKIYDTVSNYNLQHLVQNVLEIHGVDVNVYDLQGNLFVSSAANVYARGVLSRKMDPTAYFHLSRLRQVQHAQKEKIGNLSYQSVYAPVRDVDGNVYSYINIPYFTSQSELKQEISNFLVTLTNLNAFIFLIAGLIALLITNRITHSFSIISDKMREVSLGKMNEQVVWNREDEIGVLVREYNKMVTKLGESAEALAKSEREGAWREMARQVAHEIKNPLTPMKLSIQYLQKAIDNNQENVKELSSNVANTLVEQIDHLSKIAADFSQFANIGTTNVTRFDLHDVIGSLKRLYSSDERVDLNWWPVEEPLLLEADKTQMNRLFTNLIANAVEACASNGECRIDVREETTGHKVRISIKDNGEGIAPEMQSRIFVPNFTTKSSGTGLGLAMCKGIVEQAHGKIWFETEEGKGTVFYVELPLSANGV
jgi:two-component system nitrogen regulation sensor histidine kinase NtrY